MRPDDAMNNAFLYCLIEAALRFKIDVVVAQMMSNHHHVVLRDLHGNVVAFYHRFHTNLAKCVNVLRGRGESVVSSAPVSLVELGDRGAIIDAVVYTATNPVKDLLVEQVHHWPGPKTVRSLLDARVLRARRPAYFFREDGPMPEEVEMTFSIPEDLGDSVATLAEIEAGIAEVELRCARTRQETGRCVFGRRRVLRQSWREAPTTPVPRGALNPRVKARCKWTRISLIERNRGFQCEYRSAFKLLRAGMRAVFPPGTYWLARHAGVLVRGAEPRMPQTTLPSPAN